MKHQQIDIDTGRFAVGFGTMATILGGIIAVVVAAVTWGVGTAQKSDVEAIMVKHSMKPHANETTGEAVSAPAGVVTQVDKNTIAIGKIVEVVKEEREERRYIRGRIEFLTENIIAEGQQSQPARNRVRRAAKKVRAAARAKGDIGDPLAGLDGL